MTVARWVSSKAWAAEAWQFTMAASRRLEGLGAATNVRLRATAQRRHGSERALDGIMVGAAEHAACDI